MGCYLLWFSMENCSQQIIFSNSCYNYFLVLIFFFFFNLWRECCAIFFCCSFEMFAHIVGSIVGPDYRWEDYWGQRWRETSSRICNFFPSSPSKVTFSLRWQIWRKNTIQHPVSRHLDFLKQCRLKTHLSSNPALDCSYVGCQGQNLCALSSLYKLVHKVIWLSHMNHIFFL